MTTNIESAPAVDATTVEPEFCWLNVADLRPHPDNPRTTVGDLTELTRSIRARGILQPLLVLPASDDGVYFIAAGMRRHAAALKAGVTEVPVVVRPMSPIEVIEAGLSENGNRTDLTIGEELAAIERLMSLDTGVTPAKLCKRIGRSQAWVRARMAVTILPLRWRAALDRGELTLAAGEAAAALADLGPEHLEAVCEQLSGRRWSEPARTVADYRDRLRRTEAYDTAVATTRATHQRVYTDTEPAPDRARRLGELFDPDGCAAHVTESCHAVVVRSRSWGDGVESWEVCVDPRRHAPSKVGTRSGSDLVTDRSPTRRNNEGGCDDSHTRRKARIARLGHATATFAKARGGFGQADLTRLALYSLIREAGQDALKFAATMLGHSQPRDTTAEQLLDGVDNHQGLVRVAGAVALGLAENRMYWSAGSPQCRAYLDVLVATGWSPDDHSASLIERDNSDSPDHPDDESGELDDDDGDRGDPDADDD